MLNEPPYFKHSTKTRSDILSVYKFINNFYFFRLTQEENMKITYINPPIEIQLVDQYWFRHYVNLLRSSYSETHCELPTLTSFLLSIMTNFLTCPLSGPSPFSTPHDAVLRFSRSCRAPDNINAFQHQCISTCYVGEAAVRFSSTVR